VCVYPRCSSCRRLQVGGRYPWLSQQCIHGAGVHRPLSSICLTNHGRRQIRLTNRRCRWTHGQRRQYLPRLGCNLCIIQTSRYQSSKYCLTPGHLAIAVECTYEPYLFSYLAATSSAECNHCSSPHVSLVYVQLLTISDIRLVALAQW